MIVFLKGILIGVANIIPGLSGGTMAVILGLYSRIVNAISDVISLDITKIKSSLFFLFLLIFGAAIGIFLFANIIDYLLRYYSEPTFFFFIGTVIASIPIVLKSHDDMGFDLYRVSVLIFFMIIPILFLLFNISTVETVMDLSSNYTTMILLFSGFIAAVAMVLPGLSGSFILLVLGSYGTIIYAIKSFNFFVIFLVGSGVLFGVSFAAKFVKHCLNQYPSMTYYGILGLVLGSIPALWPGISLNLLFFDFISLTAGLGVVFIFKRFN